MKNIVEIKVEKGNHAAGGILVTLILIPILIPIPIMFIIIILLLHYRRYHDAGDKRVFIYQMIIIIIGVGGMTAIHPCPRAVYASIIVPVFVVVIVVVVVVVMISGGGVGGNDGSNHGEDTARQFVDVARIVSLYDFSNRNWQSFIRKVDFKHIRRVVVVELDADFIHVK